MIVDVEDIENPENCPRCFNQSVIYLCPFIASNGSACLKEMEWRWISSAGKYPFSLLCC